MSTAYRRVSDGDGDDPEAARRKLERHKPHGLTVPEWIEFLKGHWPQIYCDDPPVPFRAPKIREERVEQYEARASLRLNLFHPDDAPPVEFTDDEYDEYDPADFWKGRR